MPADPVLDLCRQWWDKAQADLVAAQRLPDLPFICGFHCQQAVEKAIKSLLVLYQIDFARSHDISLLLDLLQNSPTPPEESTAEDLESLTRFAVGTRYPPEEALPEEAEEALVLAKRFHEWVALHLPGPPSDES
ncbi:MAG: HEPN domain-containing protein [Candidatus Latescibacteria bacterium]|nr:HEPN domain-containing protein [Candidatus Latescibacterota bacterium]